jgi:hypothetical protein
MIKQLISMAKQPETEWSGDATDHELFALAEPHMAALEGRLPTETELYGATSRIGLDLATMLFYRAVLESPVHGPFIHQVNRLPSKPAPALNRPKLLIAPALFYAERPEFGGDGRLLAEIAQAHRFLVAVAPVLSRGSITENAEHLWRTIEQEPGDNLWLVSLSKGGGEVRLMLQAHAGDPAIQKLRGWINISGLVRGTPLADHYQLGVRAFFLLAGVDSRAAAELQPGHAHWQKPLVLPPHVHVINVIGVPLRHHIRQRNMLWRYTRLARYGPNDGMAPLSNLLVQPGQIYPVWGTDHFFQTPQAQPLFHRLFAYIGGLPNPVLQTTAI